MTREQFADPGNTCGYRETGSCLARREETDRRLAKLGPIRYECRVTSRQVIVLTGGHHFAANLVPQDTVERIYAGKLYADIQRGIFIVRGENVLLLGEVVCRYYQALASSFYGAFGICDHCSD